MEFACGGAVCVDVHVEAATFEGTRRLVGSSARWAVLEGDRESARAALFAVGHSGLLLAFTLSWRGCHGDGVRR